jgi:hypothetical protein
MIIVFNFSLYICGLFLEAVSSFAYKCERNCLQLIRDIIMEFARGIREICLKSLPD